MILMQPLAVKGYAFVTLPKNVCATKLHYPIKFITNQYGDCTTGNYNLRKVFQILDIKRVCIC